MSSMTISCIKLVDIRIIGNDFSMTYHGWAIPNWIVWIMRKRRINV
jgi:hypothetical protein